jgi:glycosyltransferase involved in cell wall biosynthesis
MRILYLCQRYGPEIVGGAESACRMFSERLTERGHDVHVLTSTAREYTTWANHYPAGESLINGVTVHRLPVRSERTPEAFGPMQEWITHGPRPMPTFQQRRWADLVGPDVEGLEDWLHANARTFDVAVFMTYLYTTTTRGLPALAGCMPTVLQPAAHDEPSIWATLFDTILRLPDGYLYLTPAEQEFMHRRLYLSAPGDRVESVVGIGIDDPGPGDAARFRSQHNLGDRPYLLYVGRVDSGKGVFEAARFFSAYKLRNPSDLAFVIAGEVIGTGPQHADIVYTGFLDEETKRDAMAGSLALWQPSYFESFSIVLCESWVQGRPALVPARSQVLASQVRRAGGGLPYDGFAEFEAALDLLLQQPELADELGAGGRQFVLDTYAWPDVLAEFERGLDQAAARFETRGGPHVVSR